MHHKHGEVESVTDASVMQPTDTSSAVVRFRALQSPITSYVCELSPFATLGPL